MSLTGKVSVRHSNKLHRRPQIIFVAHHEGHVTFFRRPAVRARFPLRKKSLLILVG